MKHNSLKIIGLLVAMVFFLGACGNDMQQSEGEGEKQEETKKAVESDDSAMEMDKVLDSYFDIKNALVSSDLSTAMISTNKLKARANGKIAEVAEEMNQATTLEGKRKVFESLSTVIYERVKEKGGNVSTVYKIFCPMAFDNKGAFWLSESDEVKNPYFGDEMLKCGTVKEELAAK